MFTNIAVVALAGVGALLAYAATRSGTMQVRRAANIKAPAERIFPWLADFHRWNAWSPYDRLDPAMKRVHSGAESGKGAVYEWHGNSKAGQGRMEIIETSQPSRVTIKLDFIKPFEGHNIARFDLVPFGDATNVTWTIDGPRPFVAKLMGVFVDMDKMIGKDFEAGLANLKTIVEQ